MDVATAWGVKELICVIFTGVMLLSISGSLARIAKSLSKIAKGIEISPGKQTQD